MEQRVYRFGRLYIDKAQKKNEKDQFLRWINIPGSGMLNSPGIRPLKYVHLKLEENIPSYLILVTHEKKKDGTRNPWNDVIDYSSGSILYWGDAKDVPDKKHDDFEGNKCLEVIYNAILEQKLHLVPPILHFSKPETGFVKFNGVCVMDKLELTWFSDNSVPVRNYRCHLTILDIDEVPIEWLHRRATATNLHDLDKEAPNTWIDYKKGIVNKFNIWTSEIRSKEDQMPEIGTSDAQVLEQLTDLTPSQFEAVTVALFKQLPEITHKITQTRLVGDGGFDFYGSFVLPFPISYEINFLGEAKKFRRNTAVDPKHVSRLVARLNRGQYGIFVTTSYYTKQTQLEVLEDGYPVKLFSGTDVVMFMKSLNLVTSKGIDEEWLRNVCKSSDHSVTKLYNISSLGVAEGK